MNGIKIRDYLFRYDDYFNLSATFNYFKSHILPSFFFFRSTKVFNANLCHFASRSPRFAIILRLTYGTRLRTYRLRHVSFFSFHKKKLGLFKYELSLSIHPSFFPLPFFLFSFHSLGRSLISAIWQVMPIVDPRNKSLNVRFLLWINKKNLISNRRICYKNLAMFAITRSYVVHEIFVYILTRNIMATKKKMGKKCDEESMNGLLNWNKNSHNLFNNNWFTRNSVNISKY